MVVTAMVDKEEMNMTVWMDNGEEHDCTRHGGQGRDEYDHLDG